MGRNHTNLSNCYKPLPFRLPAVTNNNDDTKTKTKNKKNQSQQQLPQQLARDSGNDQGESRSAHGLRWLRMETGITSATGSALVELGHTKVLCEVIGPTTTLTGNNAGSSNNNMDEGTLECHVSYVPNIGFPVTSLVGATASGLSDNSAQPQQPSIGRMNTQIGTTEQELSSQLLASLSAAVPLKAYPKHWIVVQVTVLQDDGSVLSACTTAASLALVDASIEVYDMVTSATVAVMLPKVNAKNTTKQPSSQLVLLADPTYAEVAHADAVVTLSLLANWKEITLWNQSGRLSSGVANEAIALCRDGCRTMHKFMRNALLEVPDGGEDNDVDMRDS